MPDSFSDSLSDTTGLRRTTRRLVGGAVEESESESELELEFVFEFEFEFELELELELPEELELVPEELELVPVEPELDPDCDSSSLLLLSAIIL